MPIDTASDLLSNVLSALRSAGAEGIVNASSDASRATSTRRATTISSTFSANASKKRLANRTADLVRRLRYRRTTYVADEHYMYDVVHEVRCSSATGRAGTSKVQVLSTILIKSAEVSTGARLDVKRPRSQAKRLAVPCRAARPLPGSTTGTFWTFRVPSRTAAADVQSVVSIARY